MLDPRFVFLAAIIDFGGILLYAADTIRGRSKPNRVTWALWTLVPLITFFAQLSQGVGLSAVLTLAISLGPLVVLIASFMNKQAYWKISNFDWACGGISLLALVFWIITKDGLTAIILSLVADFTASLPTLLKSYHFPETETANAYLAGIISSFITILTIHIWNFSTYSFPVYILGMCIIFYSLLRFPKLRPGRALHRGLT
jgi:hypothetical protein